MSASAPRSYITPTYSPQPISFSRGEGSWLYTADNTAYLDALTGIAVCGLGHCHPQVTEAIQQQAQTLVHTSNLFQIEWQEKAAESLCTAAGMDSVFFANSGAEANEAALKMARLYGYKKGFKQPKVIVMERSFHGRTLLSVSATANPKAREGFFTLDQDFIRVPFADIEAIKQVVQNESEITAVLLEPIQGEGGLNTAANGFDFLADIQALCDQNDWLFMLDEVQTGNGRTGKYFAFQHSTVQPDVLSTAKGLGNGFPIGACMVSGRARDLLQVGSHGSTYGGTPLGSRVVHSVYDVLRQTDIMQNAKTEGDYIQTNLTNELKSLGVSTRGYGMMIGVVLPEQTDCSNLVDDARTQEQLIVNVTGGHVVRLLPPLNLSRDESDQVIERLTRVIKHTLA
ncbi:aspartate aminotransferase family protein [Psychrobacter sp. FDAARGOS_221]|uniref:aspartate aminotransferase family protein n=1 Tax=Psychrobacter sp. FDAARGOS_221 TaxID=1975705 RepID=UPI000BB52DBE|nr:aspartate aminotransferase family protein [Psychrobacter sp. FDAARGOS_221]PNK59742.1 aspartate aminotransferase family protein [Psychrobacter sp. FDAARGOS_221]